jgi:fatty acid amide hydrolase
LTNLDSPPELFFPGMEAVILDRADGAHGRRLELAMRVLPRRASRRSTAHRARRVARSEGRLDRGLRIGVFEDDGYWPASPALRRAVREAAEILTRRGAIVEPFAIRPEAATLLLVPDGGRLHWERRHLRGNPVDGGIKMAMRIARVPGPLHGPIASLLGSVAGQKRLADGFRWSRKRTARGYWGLLEERTDWRNRFIAAMDEKRLDAIVCPPHAVPAMLHGATRLLYDTPSYLMRFNVLGMPAGSVAATRVRAGEETDRPRTRTWSTARPSRPRTAAPAPRRRAGRRAPWREDVVLAVMAVLEQEFSKRPDYPARPPEE